MNLLYAIFALVACSITAGMLSFAFGRSQGRQESATVRIAVGGAPGSGKTVYINVLMNALMESDDPSLRFTPESRTAAAAVQAARRMSANRWPAPTKLDGIYRYSGSLERGNPSLLSDFLGLRSEVRLELADNAGELWQELTKDSDESLSSNSAPGSYSDDLIASSFFDYLVDAQALLYFISAEDLLAGPQQARRVIEDALSAFKLISATRRRSGGGRASRMGLVVSKADVLSDEQYAIVEDLIAGGGEFSYDSAVRGLPMSFGRDSFEESVRALERLVSVFSRRADDYSGFVLSSVAGAVESGIIGDEFLRAHRIRDTHLVRSAQSASDLMSFETHLSEPIRWALSGYWRGHRSTRPYM